MSLVGREPPIAAHNLYVCLLEGGIEIQILLNNSSQLRIKTTNRTIGLRSCTAGPGQFADAEIFPESIRRKHD